MTVAAKKKTSPKRVKAEPRSPRPSRKSPSKAKRSPSPKVKREKKELASAKSWHPNPHVAKGWDKVKPNKTAERALVAEMGGGASICFLDPDNLKYPICPKTPTRCAKGSGTAKGGKGCSTQPTCQGINAAALRAQLNRNSNVKNKAAKAAAAWGC